MPEISSPHKTKHQLGGEDEINVAGLSGALAGGQTPNVHEASHRSGGSDAIAGALALAAIPTPLTGKDADTVDGKHYSDLGAEFGIFNKFLEFITWVSLDGFDIANPAGGVWEPEGAHLYGETGGLTDDYVKLTTKDCWFALLDEGKQIAYEIEICYIGVVSALTVWILITYYPHHPPEETSSHFGWKLVDGNLYASTADDATQKLTDTGVDILEGIQRTRLKIVLTPGSDCKFYVNDVLVATHTENLPVAPEYFLQLEMKTTEDAKKYIRLSRLLLQKEY